MEEKKYKLSIKIIRLRVILFILIISNFFSYFFNDDTKKLIIIIQRKLLFIPQNIKAMFSNFTLIDFLKQINNREIALILWIAVIFIPLILTNKNVINSFLQLISIAFNKIFVVVYMSATIYTFICLFILYRLSFWSTSLLKDTLIWFFLTAIVYIFKSVNRSKQPKFFLYLFKDIVKLSIIYDFLLNLYVFNLPIEIILIFIIAIISLMFTMMDIDPIYKDKKYDNAKDLLSKVNLIIMMLIIINIITSIITDSHTLFSVNTLKEFLLSLILSIMFIPYIYLFLVYEAYEQLFIRLKYSMDITVASVLKVRFTIFYKCNLNLKKIKLFSENYRKDRSLINSVSDIHNIFTIKN